MKSIYSVIIFFILSTAFVQAEWMLKDLITQENMNNLFMDWSSPQYGAIYQTQNDSILDKRLIKLTNDFGKSWKTYDFDSIAIDNNISSGDKFIQLDYFNNNIIGTGISKKIYLSTNRGGSWQIYKPLPTGKNIIKFNKNKNVGLVYNYLKSSVAGTYYLINENLNIIDTLIIPKDLNINPLNCYCCYFERNLQYFISTDGENNYTLWRVLNGKWFPYNQDFEMTGTNFINDKTGFSYSFKHNQITIYTTNDSGKTFNNSLSWSTYMLPNIVFANSKIGYYYYLSNDNISDTLSKSTDGGQTWFRDELPGTDALTFSPIQSISFLENCFYLITNKGLYYDDAMTDVNDKKISEMDKLLIFPNPIMNDGLFKIILSDDFTGVGKIKLFSQTGKYIADIKYSLADKIISGALPENLCMGLYFLQVSIDNRQQYLKIILR